MTKGPKKPAKNAGKNAGKKSANRFPKGLDEKRVRELIDHYEAQTEDEAVAEDEAAYEDATQTMMAVPVELVPAVQKLIAKRAG